MAHRLQYRRDTRENWLKYNPVLMEGEVGYETDTHHQKVGDGVSTYSELEYEVGVGNITQETGDSETLVMSQKMVSAKFAELEKGINGGYIKIDKTNEVTFTLNRALKIQNGVTYQTLSDYATTNLIPIIPNTTIEITCIRVYHWSLYYGYCFFDADKNPIVETAKILKDESVTSNYDLLTTIEVPEGASYFQCTITSASATDGTFKYYGMEWGDGLIRRMESIKEQVDTNLELIEDLSEKVDNISPKEDRVETRNYNNTSTEYGDSTHHWFVFDIDQVKQDAQVSMDAPLAWVDKGVASFDENGVKICAKGSGNNLKDFVIPKGTKTIKIYLRDLFYPVTTSLGMSITTLFGEPQDDIVFYDKMQIIVNEGSNTFITEDVASVNAIAKFKTKHYGKSIWLTDVVGVGVINGGIAFLNDSGETIQVKNLAAGSAFKYKNGVMGYKVEVPQGAVVAYATLYNRDGNSIETSKAELVKYADINDSEVLKNPLSIWVLGDSISAGHGDNQTVSKNFPWETNSGTSYGLGGWINPFMELLNPRPLKWYNYARGGWLLTDNTTDLSADSYLHEMENAISDYNNGNTPSPDIVMIVGCTNDFDNNRYVTAAEVEESMYNSFNEYMENTFFTHLNNEETARYLIPLTDVNHGKIVGAMRYIVERIGTLFPDCKFVFVTPPQSTLHKPTNQMACVNEMKWTAARLCIPCIDVWSEAQMPMLWDYTNENGDNEHRFLTDRVHTWTNNGSTNIGWKRQGEFIAQKFYEIFKYDMLGKVSL